jgi:hypothetical protein
MRVELAKRGMTITHSEALELVAHQFGYPSGNILSVKINAIDASQPPENVVLEPAVPILRIFEEEKAKEFYLGFLGFQIDWEH